MLKPGYCNSTIHLNGKFIDKDLHQEKIKDGYKLSFTAMASTCEVLVETEDVELARKIGTMAIQEAKRIEFKFSRYRDDNIVYQINHSNGLTVDVDEEAARLIDFAFQCFKISDGLFDISSGILRRVWTFDRGNKIPSQQDINKLLPKIGLGQVSWDNHKISLPSGMELDFGGIGKEYAVDSTTVSLRKQFDCSVLVNYGGDIAISHKRKNNKPWTVGVEDPNQTQGVMRKLQIRQGAVATSGDSRRFVLTQGKRYSHILNPKTGWPVKNAPRSATVVANSCLDAGILATLAMLMGSEAEEFLKQQGLQFFCIR